MNLREEFDSVKKEALDIVNKAKAESRGLNDEEKAQTEKKFSRMNEIRSVIDDEKRFSGLDLPAESTVASDAVKAVATASTFNREPMNEKISNAVEGVDILQAIKHYGRTGEVKNFAVTSGLNSGILMPKEIPGFSKVRVTTNAIRRAFAALEVSPQINSSSTENMSIPIFNDAANFGTTNAEGLTCNPRDASFATSFNLNLVEYHSEPQWYTKKVINAVDFDVTASIIPAAQSRNDRQEEVDWMATLSAATVGVTSSVSGSFAWQDLTTFRDSLGPAYEGIPVAMVVSQDFKTKMRNMADNNNRPILNFFQGVDRLPDGTPVVASVNLPGVAAGNVVGYLMAVNGLDGVVIRDTPASEVVRYEGVPCFLGQIGFEALDYSVLGFNPNAVKSFKIHA